MTEVTKTKISKFIASENGPTTVEYAVMLALVAMACTTAIVSVGSAAAESFADSSSRLEDSGLSSSGTSASSGLSASGLSASASGGKLGSVSATGLSSGIAAAGSKNVVGLNSSSGPTIKGFGKK